MAKIIYKVYGDALFDYAKENNVVEKTYEEVYDIYNVINNPDELKCFIYKTNIRKEDKKVLIKDLFINKLWPNKLSKILYLFKIDIEKGRDSKVFNFINIVIDKNRENELLNMLFYFMNKVREYKNIGLCFVTSAFELTEEQKEKLEQKLIQTTNYTQFVIEYNVDETLISGMKIQIGDRLVDSSLKSKINEISKNLRGAKV